jgi:hypothetical protein
MMTIRLPSCLLLCFGIASFLIAQPLSTGRGDGHPDKNAPPRPSIIAPFNHQGGPSPNHEPPIMMDIPELKKLLRDLNVNKPSIDKIVEITRSFLAQFDGKLIKVQREELNIKEELLKSKPDLAAIQGFIDKKMRIFAEIEFSQIKRDIEIKSLLSREEYEGLKSAMMKKMRRIGPFNEKKGDREEGGKPVPSR